MKQENNRSNSNDNLASLSFLAGFTLGGLVGAAFGLIYAPQTSEETRAVLRSKAVELSDQAKHKTEKLRQELQDRAKSIVDEQKTRLQEAVEEGRELAHAKKAELLSKTGHVVGQEAAEEPVEA